MRFPQVTNSFSKNLPLITDSVTSSPAKSFYGEPTSILFIDKYVQLPTLEEYFNELPMAVRIRERQGRKYFRFYNSTADMLANDPLVMIDWVAVTDMKKILAIAPQNISRIEIINTAYVKGDITYGGIISIISRQGDFAGIVLPSSGVFINYDFLSERSESNKTSNIYTGKFPDSRNTLYWSPDVTRGPNDITNLSFNTSDTPGHYKIILMGIDEDGKLFRGMSTFEVTIGQNTSEQH